MSTLYSVSGPGWLTLDSWVPRRFYAGRVLRVIRAIVVGKLVAAVVSYAAAGEIAGWWEATIIMTTGVLRILSASIYLVITISRPSYSGRLVL